MADDGLIVERDGDIAVVTIDRPAAYNALNAAVLAGIAAAIVDLRTEGVRAIVLTGTGQKAFSAGADLNELADRDAQTVHGILATGRRTMDAVAASPVPIIAAVNGLALGGGFELILACTFPILAENATLGLPESGLGLMPGYGGTQRLPAIIGRAAAAHVMLTGERLTAQRAYELGLTPLPPVLATELLEVARDTARAIAAKGPRAQSAILAALRTSAASETGLALESSLASIAAAGSEAAEGIAAFREKRAPVFPAVEGVSSA